MATMEELRGAFHEIKNDAGDSGGHSYRRWRKGVTRGRILGELASTMRSRAKEYTHRGQNVLI